MPLTRNLYSDAQLFSFRKRKKKGGKNHMYVVHELYDYFNCNVVYISVRGEKGEGGEAVEECLR